MVSSWHFVLKYLFILEPDIFWKITFSTVQDKIISYSKSRIEVFFFFFNKQSESCLPLSMGREGWSLRGKKNFLGWVKMFYILIEVWITQLYLSKTKWYI